MAERDPVILCVDDEKDYLKMLAGMLEVGGYRVAGATSGKEALLKLKSETIDLVLLDIAMSDMSGLEVCRKIKRTHMLRDIPVIMITGLDPQKERLRGIEAGVDDFFSKPVDQTELFARIKILLKMKKLADERKLAEAQREAALKDLQKAHDELDYQVRVRTAELAKANELLKADIEKRKQVEEALRESEAKFHDLYDNAPDMYYSLDVSTGFIVECNETLLRMTGYKREEVIGRPIFEFYDASTADETNEMIRLFRTTDKVSDVERRVRCKDGCSIDVSLNVTAIRDKDGTIKYSRSIWRDITERKKNEALIRSMAITDQLTNLYNRRGFTTLAEQQFKVAERAKHEMLLLYADMDGLKEINDKLGHESGDEAIVEASNVLKEVFRKMDIIGRMGGDEFAVLAPKASRDHSDTIKDRLRHQIELHNSHPGREYNLSFSIGAAHYDPLTPSSLKDLISHADSLMYEEKRRNHFTR